MTNLKQRILNMDAYHSGDYFDVSTVAQRFKVGSVEVRDTFQTMCNQRLLVKRARQARSTIYMRPFYNRWLSKPWAMYHPPCPTPDELTPNTTFIYGSPVYDQHET